MKTAAIVITSCGKRKSLPSAKELCAETLPPSDPASIAASWAERLAVAKNRIPARKLYQGRAFREAELAAEPIGARVYIISAGLGLIPAELEIPAYSLTVANGADNILARIEPSKAATSALWWRELKLAIGGASFDDLMRASPGLVLLAGGASYLTMIADDLARLAPSDRDRLRIFSAAPRAALPGPIGGALMPYDRRLEALPGRSGTLADFAQRALRHFAETILPESRGGTSAEHAAAVQAALDGVEAPERRRGTSKSDHEIVAIIRANWAQAGGKSAAMLRLLRDSFRIACEQKRFKKLFAAAQAEFAR
jgi:hypothetical protein